MKFTFIPILMLTLTACGQSAKDDEPAPRGPSLPLDEMVNLTSLRAQVGVTPYHQMGYDGGSTTIALLDNGFLGLEEAVGRTLPPSTDIEPWAEGEMSQTIHGTKLAELVYSIATGEDRYNPARPGPALRLYVTSGQIRNLTHAILDLIDYKKNHPEKTVIALYAQVWEYGFNHDGTGYIPELIREATKAGVVWVNAVGNFRFGVHEDRLQLDENGQVLLPGPDQKLRFKVSRDQTPVRLVLAWDGSGERFAGEHELIDLNFMVFDDQDQRIGLADLIQNNEDASIMGYSRLPREMIQATLGKGEYSIKAYARNRTEIPEGVRFWFVASGMDVTLVESPKPFIPAPALLPEVIAVGASDASFTNLATEKPDLFCPSQVLLTSGARFVGSSTAAAVCAASLAVLFDRYPSLVNNRPALRRLFPPKTPLKLP